MGCRMLHHSRQPHHNMHRGHHLSATIFIALVCLQDDCAITPVISESSANFIEGLVKDAEQQGAKLLTPYKREGNLIWPVLIDHVTQVSRPTVSCIRDRSGVDAQCPRRMACPVPPGPQASEALAQKQETHDAILCLSCPARTPALCASPLCSRMFGRKAGVHNTLSGCLGEPVDGQPETVQMTAHSCRHSDQISVPSLCSWTLSGLLFLCSWSLLSSKLCFLPSSNPVSCLTLQHT